MFTGIVVEQGVVKKVRERGHVELEIEAPRVAKELNRGDSVSINGVCLTATQRGRRTFRVQMMSETTTRSTLGDLRRGSLVNLELAARFGDRIGGHIVQGHVDGVATVTTMEEDATARRIWLATDDDVLRYLVPRGSVTLDGVSLTVVEVGNTTFQVAIIPHTLEVTTLGKVRTGSRVNVEVDVLAKYVERLNASSAPR